MEEARAGPPDHMTEPLVEKSADSCIGALLDELETSPKAQAIIDACKRRDLRRLADLAESQGGYLTTHLRQRAWPVLLGVSHHQADDDKKQSGSASAVCPGEDEKPETHRDEAQVELDVNRAFVYYPSYHTQAAEEEKKRELQTLIVDVLRRHPFLNYFQGYHDICQVLLLVLPPELQVTAVARLSVLRIRDYMCSTMNPVMAQLYLIPEILRKADPKLWVHVAGTKPFFALSSTLTMYAHDVTSLDEISRLFDILLAKEPTFGLYMYVATILSKRDEIFETPAEEEDVLHVILSKLPKQLDLDALIASASRLFEQYPPESLRSWRNISTASVLKTARSLEVVRTQTLEEGEAYFKQQEQELEQARRWVARRKLILTTVYKYRQPAGAVGLALLVGAFAFWLRRSPGLVSHLSNLVSNVVSLISRGLSSS